MDGQPVVDGKARVAVGEAGDSAVLLKLGDQRRSLGARHPLMFSFAREFTGPDTAKGREMTRLWQYEGYRRIFRVITAVWGVAFLLEAALRVVIVYNTSAGTALAASKVTPFLFFGILSAWTVAYGAHHKRKGERMATATSGVTEASPAPEGK